MNPLTEHTERPQHKKPIWTRRTLLRSGMAAAAVGAGAVIAGPSDASRRQRVQQPTSTPAASTASTGSTGSAPFLPYGPDSYLRKPIVGAPINTQRTLAFRQFMATHPDQRSWPYPKINGTDSNRWGTAFALGTASDPVWTLTGTMSTFCACLRTTGFHAPAWLGDVLTGTSDSPFCVIDQGSGLTVFGTKAKVVGARTIAVASGAVTYHTSNGLHRNNPLSDDKRNFTSRGRISEAMVIRSDLVSHGIANNSDLGHVLHMFLCETRSSDGFRSPMVAAEGGKEGFGAEGERIAIHPSVDLSQRGLSPAGLVVARTLQKYGCYFGDNAGSSSTLKAEQEYSNHPVWNKTLGRDSLAGLRWEDFVVLSG